VLDEFLEKQKEQLKAFDRAIDDERKALLKGKQVVSDGRRKEKALLGELQSSQAYLKTLDLKLQTYDREAQQQMRLLYNANFKIQQMEQKVDRLKGERTEDEKEELESRIETLTRVLERKLATDKLTRQQLQRQDLELKKATRRKEAIQKTQADLETQLREINIDQDSINKAAIKARLQREDVLVRTNVLRVQIAKKLVQLNAKADEVMSLENRKKQLRLSMQERIDEVDVHLATLRVQQNKEDEARHRIQVELSDRKHRCETAGRIHQHPDIESSHLMR
jgi:chromosome segregation ATPase